MDTSALISIEEVVTRYLLKYKKSNDDYLLYLEHACNSLRQYRVHSAPEARTEKISVSALGIIEMPTDLIRLKDVSVAYNGEWWTMTERPDMVNTTTFTGVVEGHDSTFGEGVALKDGITYTYGARGGVNSYYYMVDYNARRIFCDGIVSDTALLKYVSSGIALNGTTYVPDLLTEVIDNYLLWKETYWIQELVRERKARQDDLKDANLKVRNVINSMSASQWRDLFWGSMTQTPKR